MDKEAESKDSGINFMKRNEEEQDNLVKEKAEIETDMLKMA